MKPSFRSQMCVIPQQPLLFTGTLRDNIDVQQSVSEEPERIDAVVKTCRLGRQLRFVTNKANVLLFCLHCTNYKNTTPALLRLDRGKSRRLGLNVDGWLRNTLRWRETAHLHCTCSAVECIGMPYSALLPLQ